MESLILLDFDHTLFDTDRFFWVDLRAAVLGLGVDGRLWEETYEAVWPGGYSIDPHVEALAARTSWPHPPGGFVHARWSRPPQVPRLVGQFSSCVGDAPRGMLTLLPEV